MVGSESTHCQWFVTRAAFSGFRRFHGKFGPHDRKYCFAPMSTSEVVTGIAQIGLGFVSAFVIRGEGGPSLVDCGLRTHLGRVRSALSDAGGADRLRHVVITHHHRDHIGPLGEVVTEATEVWAHPADAVVIRGVRPSPSPDSRSTLERAVFRAMDRVGPQAPPARVDHELTDGQEIPIGDGVIAYHTPGHTAGHVSFLMPSKRVLFVGDAAANYFGRLGPPFGLSSEDHAEVRRSIAKIAALDFDIACFGHGRVLKGGAAAAFRRLAEKVAR